MAFRWRADVGPTLNASLVALWFFRGSGPVLLRNPIFLWFSRGGGGGGSGPPVPPPLWIRTWISLRIRNPISISFPPKETLEPWLHYRAPIKAQSDQSLRWAHIFSCFPAHSSRWLISFLSSKRVFQNFRSLLNELSTEPDSFYCHY